jgi:hypothetical protein
MLTREMPVMKDPNVTHNFQQAEAWGPGGTRGSLIARGPLIARIPFLIPFNFQESMIPYINITNQ